MRRIQILFVGGRPAGVWDRVCGLGGGAPSSRLRDRAESPPCWGRGWDRRRGRLPRVHIRSTAPTTPPDIVHAVLKRVEALGSNRPARSRGHCPEGQASGDQRQLAPAGLIQAEEEVCRA